LVNYYEILGLKTGAGINEIKAAFRQLAKLYHPDVNPQGKEQFTKILKAYEILSDPNLKYAYDYKLNAHLEGKKVAETRQKRKNPKEWKFDEREMKRRQYYDEHIKKYEKKFNDPSYTPPPKSTYNEFKYILFATPLAVILFLGIMTLASDKKADMQKKKEVKETPATNEKKELQMGDAPYEFHFGPGIYDTAHHAVMVFKNLTSSEMIVCLFNGHSFVRSFYLESDYSAEVPQLPQEKLEIRYTTGKHFNSKLSLAQTGIRGGFSEDPHFYKSITPVSLQQQNELTLMPGENQGFKSIEAPEFFEKLQ
jgi:hypothetical protein